MKKVLALIFAVVTVLCICTACGPSGKLVVGMDLSNPGMDGVDANGNAVGVLPDMANRIGEYMGREVEIVKTEYNDLLPALKEGKIDLILSSDFYLPSIEEAAAQKNEVIYTNPYAVERLAIFAQKDVQINDSFLNNPETKMAYTTGSSAEVYAKSQLTNTVNKGYESEDACFTALLAGEVNYMIAKQGFLYNKYLEHQDYKVTPISYQDSTFWTMAVRSGDKGVAKKINRFIEKTYEDSNYFEEVSQQYVKELRDGFDSLNLTWYFNANAVDNARRS